MVDRRAGRCSSRYLLHVTTSLETPNFQLPTSQLSKLPLSTSRAYFNYELRNTDYSLRSIRMSGAAIDIGSP